MFWRLSIVLFTFPLTLAASTYVQLGLGLSRTLKVPQLGKATVASGKIARVRAVPPTTLVVTGLKVGKTTVRAWDRSGRESAFDVTVLPLELLDPLENNLAQGVVKVSLEFLELDGALTQSLGIRWPEALQFSGAANAGTGISGLNYTASFTSAQGWIHHLLREGWAKVLASPELHVRLGEEARFHSGGEIPVATSSENYGRSHKHVEWKPYGLHVKVRPRSGDNLHISSDIEVDVSEVDASRAWEGVPSLTKRHLETKMQSLDGETVILSGLLRKTAMSERSSVPLLSSIPLIGNWLFSHRREGSEQTDIFMAITFSFNTRRQQREEIESFRERFRASDAP